MNLFTTYNSLHLGHLLLRSRCCIHQKPKLIIENKYTSGIFLKAAVLVYAENEKDTHVPWQNTTDYGWQRMLFRTIQGIKLIVVLLTWEATFHLEFYLPIIIIRLSDELHFDCICCKTWVVEQCRTLTIEECLFVKKKESK